MLTETEKTADDEAKRPAKPVATDLETAIEAVNSLLEQHSNLYYVVQKLRDLLPEKAPPEEKYTRDMLVSHFVSGNPEMDTLSTTISLNPLSLGLLVLNDLFQDSERFEEVEPMSLPYAEKLELPYTKPKSEHTVVDIASQSYTVPMMAEHWFFDKKHNANFVVSYQPNPSTGSLMVSVEGGRSYGALSEKNATVAFIQELKKCVLLSKYLRGQIIEISGGSDFRIVEIEDQPMPIIDKDLKDELDKNIVNLFSKQEDFKKYNIPLKRAVILEGPPGCGKTMISRYLANSVKGKVTTIWVTAKSIEGAHDVANVFEIARKLSPSLVVMEDLDLISGTREMFMSGGGNALGEMLNQLDGLTSNDSLVLVASTNRVSSLDEALSDRPGRFDRIYQLGKPNAELAKQIARNYLYKCNIDKDAVDALSLSSILNSEFTGAQIVEIIKGAVFEAVHRGCTINDLCIKKSRDGLEQQRKKIKSFT